MAPADHQYLRVIRSRPFAVGFRFLGYWRLVKRSFPVVRPQLNNVSVLLRGVGLGRAARSTV